jgi:hypothetical protein
LARICYLDVRSRIAHAREAIDQAGEPAQYFPSFWLRTRPFAFLDGATAVFDWQPLTDQYNTSPTPQSADVCAIASNFYAVEEDMRPALAEYGRTQ